MRLIDADKYKEEIMLIMRCWNISPVLSPSEARKSVRNLEVALRILSEIPTFCDMDKIIKKLETYKSQQSENEMLSENGKWFVKKVIEECIKIVKSGGVLNGKEV